MGHRKKIETDDTFGHKRDRHSPWLMSAKNNWACK